MYQVPVSQAGWDRQGDGVGGVGASSQVLGTGPTCVHFLQKWDILHQLASTCTVSHPTWTAAALGPAALWPLGFRVEAMLPSPSDWVPPCG